MKLKPTKLRTTRRSSKGQRDEPAAAAAETKVPARDDRFRGPATLDPQVRHQMIACAAHGTFWSFTMKNSTAADI